MKTFEGIVVATKMQKTAVVMIVRKTPHPLYKKLIKRSKKYKVDTSEITVQSGDRVRIGQTRPISKEKTFKIIAKLGDNRASDTKKDKVVAIKSDKDPKPKRDKVIKETKKSIRKEKTK